MGYTLICVRFERRRREIPEAPRPADLTRGRASVVSRAVMKDDAPKPKSAEATLTRAWDLLDQGDLAGAREAAQSTLRIDEHSPEAHNTLGYIFSLEGDLEEALVHYEHAIEADDEFFEALLNAAEVRLRMGDFDGSMQLCDRSVEVAESDDDFVEAMLVKMDVLMALHKPAEAEALVELLPDGPFESPTLELAVGARPLGSGRYHRRSRAHRARGSGPCPPMERRNISWLSCGRPTEIFARPQQRFFCAGKPMRALHARCGQNRCRASSGAWARRCDGSKARYRIGSRAHWCWSRSCLV